MRMVFDKYCEYKYNSSNSETRSTVPVREYSYPRPKLLGSSNEVGRPGLDCWKVVARLIGKTTAPVGFPGSGALECSPFIPWRYIVPEPL